jgi:uncharacterized membrane protein YqhA
MKSPLTQLSNIVSYAVIAILSITVFRLLMPHGKTAGSGFWLASILFAVVIVGILHLTMKHKKK